jgi:hypothetical protein
MIIKSHQASGPCDNDHECCGTATHGVVTQGATGRFCEVMWICRECAIQWAGGEDKILSHQDAFEKCENDPTGWPEF